MTLAASGAGDPGSGVKTGHFLTVPLFSGKLGVFLSRMERVSDSSKLSSTRKLLATPLKDC